MNKTAVVLLSGGQDSTTCLFWAKKHFEKVYAIGFRYGQKHEHEVDIAASIAADAGVPFTVVNIDGLNMLTQNSLTNHTMVMDEEKPDGTPPNTFVPGRNMIFLNYAAVYAYTLGAGHLITGVSQADYNGYPDCRNTFIKSVNASLNLALDYELEIHTPLMWLDKENVWKMADELGVFDIIHTRTLTCYNGVVADGCGKCPACKLRSRGLEAYVISKHSD